MVLMSFDIFNLIILVLTIMWYENNDIVLRGDSVETNLQKLRIWAK